MSKWIDKSPQSDVKLQHLELKTGEQPFFATKVDVSDEAMAIGAACSTFQRRIASMQDLADVATDAQNAYIEDAIDSFLETSGLGEYKRKTTALQMENGRLRAKLKRESGDENV